MPVFFDLAAVTACSNGETSRTQGEGESGRLLQGGGTNDKRPHWI